MSKGVQDRIQRSRSVILAGYVYSQVVTQAWQRRLSGFLNHLRAREESERLEGWLAELAPEGRSPVTLGDAFRFIAMDLEQRGAAMVAADEALNHCRADLRRLRQRRDQLAKALYRELSETRNFFIGLLGYQKGCDYLDLKGPTPRVVL